MSRRLRFQLDEKSCEASYRVLFRTELDAPAFDEIWLAINPSKPLGDSRFLVKVESIACAHHNPRSRGLSRFDADDAEIPAGQRTLNI